MSRTPESTPRNEPDVPRWLRSFSALAALAAFCVVAHGGTVASGASAAAAQEGWAFAEQAHRLTALVVSLVVWALTAVLWLRPPRRRAAGWLALGASLASAALMTRAILEDLHESPPVFSVLHAAMATLFLSFSVSVAVLLGRRWGGVPEGLAGSSTKPQDIRWLLWMSLCLLLSNLLQTVLGAIPRHTFRGDVPHILWAFVFFIVVIVAAGRVFGRHSRLPGILRPVFLLFFLSTLELFIGFSAYVTRPDTLELPSSAFFDVTVSLHQVAGALMQVAAVVLVLRVIHLRRFVLEGAGEATRSASARGA